LCYRYFYIPYFKKVQVYIKFVQKQKYVIGRTINYIVLHI